MDNQMDESIKMPPFVRMFYFILELSYLGLMLNEPRRGGQSTGRRWSAKHGTPAKSMVCITTPKGRVLKICFFILRIMTHFED